MMQLVMSHHGYMMLWSAARAAARAAGMLYVSPVIRYVSPLIRYVSPLIRSLLHGYLHSIVLLVLLLVVAGVVLMLMLPHDPPGVLYWPMHRGSLGHTSR